MTHFDTIRTAAPAFGIMSFARRSVAAITAWNQNRMTRRSLLKLTDRELDDIGLTRSDIARL